MSAQPTTYNLTEPEDIRVFLQALDLLKQDKTQSIDPDLTTSYDLLNCVKRAGGDPVRLKKILLIYPNPITPKEDAAIWGDTKPIDAMLAGVTSIVNLNPDDKEHTLESIREVLEQEMKQTETDCREYIFRDRACSIGCICLASIGGYLLGTHRTQETTLAIALVITALFAIPFVTRNLTKRANESRDILAKINNRTTQAIIGRFLGEQCITPNSIAAAKIKEAWNKATLTEALHQEYLDRLGTYIQNRIHQTPKVRDNTPA